MKPHYLYVLTSPEAVKIYDDHTAQCEAIQATAQRFADQFAAEGQKAQPLYYRERNALAGVVFTPTHTNDVIWTRPTPNGTQSPRQKPKKQPRIPLSAEEVAEHARIHALWNESYPRGGADTNDLIEALTGVQNRFMVSAKVVRASDTEILIAISEPIRKTEGVRELTASEYFALEKK